MRLKMRVRGRGRGWWRGGAPCAVEGSPGWLARPAGDGMRTALHSVDSTALSYVYGSNRVTDCPVPFMRACI
eukprot:27457-Eustigmatos_ZCMA.PRE.1